MLWYGIKEDTDDKMIELIEKIKQLKKEKNAIILTHCYQPVELDEVSDFVGDSFYNDILPASKLKWHTIWLNLYDEKMIPPEHSCNTVNEVYKILLSYY